MKNLFHDRRYFDHEGQTYKLSTYFSEGTYRNYENVGRGYYMSLVPCTVEIKNGYKIETTGAFTGAKQLLFEAKRQSRKNEEKALQMAKEQEKSMLDYILSSVAGR